MHRLASVVVPILVAVGASVWLHGRPGSVPSRQLWSSRRRSVFALAGVSAVLAVLALLTRAQWAGSKVPSDVALSVLLGLIFITLGLLIAALPRRFVRAPSNKRLKLTGGDRSKGVGVLCAGAHELSFNDTARGGRVARSLSAIR